MDQTSAHLRSQEPHDAPDLLTGGVLNSLNRPLDDYGAWRASRSVIVGGLTLGLAPLILWPRRFREFIGVEQQQLWHLAEWLRLRTGAPEATDLRDAAERIRFRPALWFIGLLSAGTVLLAFLTHYNGIPEFRYFLGAAYNELPGTLPGRLRIVFNPQFNFIWTIGLTLAYALHWMQVKAHAWDVRRFVAQFNRIAALEGVAPLAKPMLGWGIRPLWIIGALILASFGALWALPMMLAGALQRQYIVRTSAGVRSQLADRVRTILVSHRPAMRVPQPVWMRRTCQNPSCRSTLAPVANFCPRCGTRAAESVSAVA